MSKERDDLTSFLRRKILPKLGLEEKRKPIRINECGIFFRINEIYSFSLFIYTIDIQG